MTGRPNLVSLALALTATILFVALPGVALGQRRAIRVVAEDGQPITYASIVVDRGRANIADERGEVPLLTAPGKTIAFEVRRFGFDSYQGRLGPGDTGSVLVTLHHGKRSATKVATDQAAVNSPALLAFYRRALAAQQGNGAGVYVTPEEVERRRPGMTTGLLQGIAGISLKPSGAGRIVAYGRSGACQMSVLVDGQRQVATSPSMTGSAPPPSGGRRTQGSSTSIGDTAVVIDRLVPSNEVLAMEIYPREGNAPPELAPTGDFGCGMIAIWTGRHG